jgi:hypothetical protein
MWTEVDAETEERITKYEAHVRSLEAELVQLATHRGWIRFVPLGGALAPLGLFASAWVAIGIGLGFLLLAMVAGYLNASRTWYTRDQLAAARQEIEKLRHGDPDRDPVREMRFWRRTREEIAEINRRRLRNSAAG